MFLKRASCARFRNSSTVLRENGNSRAERASAPRNVAMASTSAMKNGCRSSAPHTFKAIRPPGASTRAISFIALPRSGKYCTLLAEHYVKGGFSERQFGCAPLVPRDLRVATGGGQHALVDIDPVIAQNFRLTKLIRLAT